MNRSFHNRIAVCLIFGQAFFGTHKLIAGEAPPLGKTKEIEITEDLPKLSGGKGRIYEFIQRIEQGDKLRIYVAPVGNAEFQSKIRVFEESSKSRVLEQSGTEKSHDWTMSKEIPGKEVRIQIVGFSRGKLNIRVDKVK